MADTIFALSSGPLPCAIAVIRVSGGLSGDICSKMAGSVPEPRRASLRVLQSASGDVLDSAVVVWFPGPNTSTGEDCLELHCHGGRAVVARVEHELMELGARAARAGEFTQRAFENGRLALDEVEALGDLLAAETELQRMVAQQAFGGGADRPAMRWREDVLRLSALVESMIDFDDEDDVGVSSEEVRVGIAALRSNLAAHLERPTSQRLREGVRVVFAGPPNSGKSSLFNALLNDAAAIISPIAGTTRDVIERPIAIDGIPFVFVDTAGLRGATSDAIEEEGILRARAIIERADIVLWLGEEGKGPSDSYEVAAKSDLGMNTKSASAIAVSARNGAGLVDLTELLVGKARNLVPKPGENALNERQRHLAVEAQEALRCETSDLLVLAEQLRYARSSFDRMIGSTTTEDMLDALFGRFCIGK